MIDPPPQAEGINWVWKKWFNQFWSKAVHTDGGQTISGSLTIGSNLDLTSIPTSDPVQAGRVWNDSGTLKISAG